MSYSLAIFGCCGVVRAAPADDSRSLRGGLTSADTAIAVEAGEHAPRLTALKARGSATGWTNRAEETLPERLEVHGATQTLVWSLDRSASHFGSHAIQLVYLSDSPRLKLEWLWRVRAGHGPIEHTLLIQNLSGESVWLPLQPSVRFDWQIDDEAALERFWVEKGADVPSAEGTHLDALREGDTWQGSSSTYARPMPNQPREMIPYVLIDEPSGARRGWYVGIESSARTRITLQRAGTSLKEEAGLNPVPGPYRTRLPPGGTFATPTIFLGAFAGGPDGAGNILRRWVRAVLNNPRTLSDPSYPPMVSNSWGSGMAVNEALVQRMITDSAQLGLEMFHLDAGWFRDVGDWQADPAKFPEGIASVADFAHRHGLKFGLWIDWTQAGTSNEPGALNVGDPATRDWLIADPPAGWKHHEPFKGITIDLGVPAAQAWAARELERVVSGYHLDMLEHDGYLVAQGSSRADHPAAPPDPATLRTYEDSGFLWVDGSNSTDVSDHASKAYYGIYERLRARHPTLLLEVCNDGGRMVDFGSAAHGDYFSITDTYDPLSNRRAFYDTSFVLPPAMLETYVARWPAPRIENFRYMLRSGMLGWFTLMQGTSEWSLEQRAEAQVQFALYRSALRPLLREADVYHVAERPDGVRWDGIEYYSARLRRGVLYAFRGTAPDQATHRFRLLGLKPESRYRLKFQDQGAAANLGLTGRMLMREGVEVTLGLPLSSELIFLEEVP
ncbi:MAG TPA: glycoside hydrolase family 36 protein [Steroidobacteraceae bacterium]|nr:glycoside hydrolase family 36 protein [Steroidobacteraceae bacterium]